MTVSKKVGSKSNAQSLLTTGLFYFYNQRFVPWQNIFLGSAKDSTERVVSLLSMVVQQYYIN